MRTKTAAPLAILVLFLFPLLAGAQLQKVAAGKKIMIAAHPLAAKAGLEIYRQGGNVVDVAVAVAYALGVVEPHGSGIGGEGMMLIYNAREKRYVVVDFKAISPATASYQTVDFANRGEWNRTAKGACVPGVVAGLELARESYGKLDRRTVLQPAIEYALNGFEVDSTLALNLEYYRTLLENDPYSLRTFYPGGNVPKIGDAIQNPDYARTLKEIQAHGPEAFYKGKIADLIVRDAEKRGGFITKDDLRTYRPVRRDAVRGTYRGYEIVTTPPPCGGMLLIEALNILKHFDLQECRTRDGYVHHLFAEVFKLIFKDEATYNGDPEFTAIPVQRIISDEYAFRRLLEIDLSRSMHPVQVKAGPVEEKHTTHLSVMDIEGNAVALTVTLSSLFGTATTVEGGGFLLNNEMQNYSADESHPNSLKPHKRVVTSLVPTIVAKDGEPWLVLGTPGGDLIISTIAQVIVNVVDFGMSLPEAIAAPRMFSIHTQRELEMEDRFPQSSYRLLESLGHDMKRHAPFRAYFCAVQAVMRDRESRTLIGSSDPRRSGAAIGE